MADKQGNIEQISITHDTDQNIQTIRGIKVGDPLDAVINKYGNNFYKRTEQGVDIIRYKHEGKHIEFWHWNNVIQEIRLGLN